MRGLGIMISPRAGLAALALTLITRAAQAQTLPPAAPPGPPAPPPAAAQAPLGYAPPPSGYAPPPDGYALPPGYAYAPPPGYAYAPPPGYQYRPLVNGPETLPYQDGYPIPDGYRPGTRRRTGLIIAGAATFGAVYALNVLGASAGGDNGALFVPVVGPFIELGHLNASPLTPLAGIFLVLDGLAQTAGVAMLIGGIASTKPVLVRQDVAKTTVRITPLTMGYAGTAPGIGLVGTM